MIDLTAENKELRARLAEAEETIEAIRSGAVDALVTTGPAGEQVFTLQGAETPYRLLTESMNEGAATVARDGTVLYSNRRFAEMAGLPAEQVVGSSIFQCVVPEQGPRLRELLTQVLPGGSKAEFTFSGAGDPGLPALLSLSPIAMDAGAIAVLATDLSEGKRYEQKLNQLNEELEERVRRRTSELQESEQRLLHAQQIANVGSWEWDIPTGAMWWSEQMYRQAGQQPGAFRPTHDAFRQLLHPDDRAPVDDAVERALAGAAPYDIECRIVPPTGAVRVLHTRGEVLPGPDGSPHTMVGVSLDITERKQAERDLFAANQRLQALMQALPVGVSFSDDATCQRITGNPTVLAQFEVTSADNLSASAPDDAAFGRQVRFFRDGQPMTDADFPLQRAVAENREVPPIEFEVLLPSGRRWCAQASGAPIRDQQGRVVAGVAVTVDITALKQAEAALRTKEAELRAITDVTPVLLTRCSRDLRYRYANKAYAAMLGCTPDQIVGKPIVEIIGEKGFATIRPRVEQVLQGRPVECEDQVHFALTGESRWLHATYMPDRDEHGEVIGWIASIADITQRKEAEEALRRIEEERKVAEAVQSERQRLKDVLNLLPAYVVLLSPDHYVPFANRFFEERFGKAEGRRCYEYLFNRKEPCEACESFKVLQTNASQRWEWTGPDGRDYDISDFPFRDVDGSQLIMEVGLDITERKKAEAELNRHREHLQELVQERTAKLHATNEELSRFNQAMVGRELRMIELKQEINALCAALGRPPAYPIQAEKEEPETRAKP